jgi:mRNA interferase RelE/StbE
LKTEFRKSFVDDLEDARDRGLRARVNQVIGRIEGARSLREVGGVKKLHRPGHYRIRIGSYRLGFVLSGDTVIFVRFLHRRDIHRYFP